MTVTLQSKSGEYKFEVNEDEPLLFAGLRAGLKLPHECATGTCGTCRARVMEGDVEPGWADAPGMKRYNAEKGDVLMCQAHAKGNCLLRVPVETPEVQNEKSLPQLHQGKVNYSQKLTSDVIHFEIAMSEPVSFKAGQFMVVNAPDLIGGRAYSMVNFEAETDIITFVVKRKPGGGVSNWLFENDINNCELTLFGPLGAATFNPDEGRDLICITGGSGVAGIMSILDHASQSGHFSNHTGRLYFGVKTLADGFYIKELASMVKGSDGNLEVTLALSDEVFGSSVHPEFPQIKLAEGFVHEVAANALTELSGANENTIGYVAGPAPMVDGAIRTLIVNAGLSPQQIRYDKFS